MESLPLRGASGGTVGAGGGGRSGGSALKFVDEDDRSASPPARAVIEDDELPLPTPQRGHHHHHRPLPLSAADCGSCWRALREQPLQSTRQYVQRHRSLVWAAVAATVLAVLICVAVAIVVVVSTDKGGGGGGKRGAIPPQFVDAVRLESIQEHLQSLNSIANLHGGSRAVLLGYNASAEYVIRELGGGSDDARQQRDTTELSSDGFYNITRQYFYFEQVTTTAGPFLSMSNGGDTSGNATTYAFRSDFRVIGGSTPSINVTLATAVANNSGCAAGDYAAAAGLVAVAARGGCSFYRKAQAAVAGGAAALLISNFADLSVDQPTGGSMGDNVPLVVYGVTHTLGQLLSQAGTVVHMERAVTQQPVWSYNVLVETTAQAADAAVVLVGAHLDSVPAGPGINDNGSGSMTVLEMARTLQRLRIRTRNRVRWCFWTAEELGLLGSTHYVNKLEFEDPAALARLALNLNFDMLGSPNYQLGVYNGSSADAGIRAGSAYLQQLFEQRFAQHKPEPLYYDVTPFDGRSDYGAFIEIGVPAGGLAAGAEGIKTVAQRAGIGGMANAPYDACYHQSCDSYLNVNPTGLSYLADAAANAVIHLAELPDLFQTMGRAV